MAESALRDGHPDIILSTSEKITLIWGFIFYFCDSGTRDAEWPAAHPTGEEL